VCHRSAKFDPFGIAVFFAMPPPNPNS